MIIDKIIQVAKSPKISKSWLAQNRLVQRCFRFYLKIYNALATRTGIVGKTVRGSLGKENTVSPSAFIDYDRVVIGDSCVIGSRAVIEKNSQIGNRVRIGPGTVVASEGFEIRRIGGDLIPVVHVGGVTIHDDTVIGSFVCIDKSVYGDDTEIMEKTRIDNFVHVAHGVKIGTCCSIGASAMIGGKVVIGNDVTLGYRAIISDQIEIGDGAIISPGAVVTKNVLPGQKVTGNFAISHDKFLKFFSGIR
jgi:UDP-3-O-[3-hydroxymyristoyl] glucosamine N-acyltransferase